MVERGLKLNSVSPNNLSEKFKINVRATKGGVCGSPIKKRIEQRHIHCSPLLRMPSSLHLPHIHLPFPPHHHHHGDGHGSSKEEAHDIQKDVPKGCVAVYVGSEEEEQQRFVIPAVHINHHLFQKFLKEAEEEYGFEQKGAITIPCHVSDFQYVEGLIEHQQQDHSHSTSFCFR